MNNDSTKKVLLSVLGVAILVVAVVGVSFAFFTYSKQGSTENTITTGTLVFKYEEKTGGINLTNAIPISDEEGKALTGSSNVFDFTVTSNIQGDVSINYEIAVKETSNQEENTTLDSKYVKLRLSTMNSSDGSGLQEVKLDHFNNLRAATNDPSAKALATGTATSGTKTQWYRLQMWMAETDADGDPTQMKSDVCTADGSPVGPEHPAVECEEGSHVVEKGTNGKTFKIKVNVYAKNAE